MKTVSLKESLTNKMNEKSFRNNNEGVCLPERCFEDVATLFILEDLNPLADRLEAKIEELEQKAHSEYIRGIEDGKIIAEHGTTMWQE